jgi:hypothetical protein
MKTFKLTLSCLLIGVSFSAGAIEELTSASSVEAAPVAAEAGNSSVTNRSGLKKASLTFMDSKLFDGKLAKELDSGKDVIEVEISGRMPLNNIPSRIDRWLIVSADEGTVETLPSPPKVHSKGIFLLAPMVFSAFGYFKNMQEEKMYDTAKRYDTKIYYRTDENGDSLIDKIVLVKRKPVVH